jgi:hypothetical protein
MWRWLWRSNNSLCGDGGEVSRIDLWGDNLKIQKKKITF